MSPLDDRIGTDTLTTSRVVYAESLRSVERRRLLVHTITAAVDELLERGAADPDGMIVTVHSKPGGADDDDLVVTVTTPHYDFANLK